jgi:hypothetical protein
MIPGIYPRESTPLINEKQLSPTDDKICTKYGNELLGVDEDDLKFILLSNTVMHISVTCVVFIYK